MVGRLRFSDWTYREGTGLATDNKKHPHILAKGYAEKKVNKGTRWMPRLSEAMKDVISCDKPRGSAHMI